MMKLVNRASNVIFGATSNKKGARALRMGIVIAFSSMGALAPVHANPIVVTGHPITFRGLEFDYSGEQRIDVAEAALHSAIPVGSKVIDARSALTHAGAICHDRRPEEMTCVSNGFDVVENILHDVSWTIEVDHQGGSVTNLAIDRESIGS
jgi:hypothetical protein